MMVGALYRYARYALCFRGKVTPLAAGCEAPDCDAPGESLAPGKRPAAPGVQLIALLSRAQVSSKGERAM